MAEGTKGPVAPARIRRGLGTSALVVAAVPVVLGMSSSVEVVRPAGLRRALLAEARAALERYGGARPET